MPNEAAQFFNSKVSRQELMQVLAPLQQQLVQLQQGYLVQSSLVGLLAERAGVDQAALEEYVARKKQELADIQQRSAEATAAPVEPSLIVTP